MWEGKEEEARWNCTRITSSVREARWSFCVSRPKSGRDILTGFTSLSSPLVIGPTSSPGVGGREKDPAVSFSSPHLRIRRKIMLSIKKNKEKRVRKRKRRRGAQVVWEGGGRRREDEEVVAWACRRAGGWGWRWRRARARGGGGWWRGDRIASPSSPARRAAYPATRFQVTPTEKHPPTLESPFAPRLLQTPLAFPSRFS